MILSYIMARARSHQRPIASPLLIASRHHLQMSSGRAVDLHATTAVGTQAEGLEASVAASW